MSALRERFECPIPWCAGDVEEHGGDGTLPHEWLHSSDSLPLSGVLWANIWCTGSGPVRWAVYVGNYGAVVDDAGDVEEVATLLEDAAHQLRALALLQPDN